MMASNPRVSKPACFDPSAVSPLANQQTILSMLLDPLCPSFPRMLDKNLNVTVFEHIYPCQNKTLLCITFVVVIYESPSV